jgi:hypothetical protein
MPVIQKGFDVKSDQWYGTRVPARTICSKVSIVDKQVVTGNGSRYSVRYCFEFFYSLFLFYRDVGRYALFISAIHRP